MITNHITVFVTCGTADEARHIAKMLVHEKLAACANFVTNATSVYSWQGRIMEESEVLLFLKTETAFFEKLKARIIEMHSYDVPCIVAWPIVTGSEDYLSWISSTLAENHGGS